MIGRSSEMWTSANESTTADATMESLRECAEKLASMGPILVRFIANYRGFIALRPFYERREGDVFQGVPIHESDDYDDSPFMPARILAVMRDPRTGMETEKLVYGAAA